VEFRQRLGAYSSSRFFSHAEIPFLKDIKGAEWYQLRSRTRAGEGDFFAATKEELKDYEAYNQKYLKLGNPQFLFVGGSDEDAFYITKGVSNNKSVFSELSEIAKKGGLGMIHPYMGVYAAWELAANLSKGSPEPIKVLSPPPPMTNFANNKSKFTALVIDLLGEENVTKSLSSAEPKQIAKNLKKLSKDYKELALKIATYTSGMGNALFSGEKVAAMKDDEVLRLVEDYLVTHEWDKKESVLAVEWKHDVLQSPSTQTWIPPKEDGLPIIEGVYEQFLIGPKRVFEGSSPSILGKDLQEKMARNSFLIAMVFQEMGYIGRCSFDLIISGKKFETSIDSFVECNGRWGGTSIPMSLVNRIFGDYRKIKYRATDYIDNRLKGLNFTQLMEIFKDDLYDRETGKGRFVFYNPGCLTDYGKFDVISIGASREEAFAGIDKVIPDKLNHHFT